MVRRWLQDYLGFTIKMWRYLCTSLWSKHFGSFSCLRQPSSWNDSRHIYFLSVYSGDRSVGSASQILVSFKWKICYDKFHFYGRNCPEPPKPPINNIRKKLRFESAVIDAAKGLRFKSKYFPSLFEKTYFAILKLGWMFISHRIWTVLVRVAWFVIFYGWLKN